MRYTVMKITAIAAILTLGAALIAVPSTNARAALDDSARVCGRVDAPSSFILDLSLARPTPGNFIYAVSESETVQTTVRADGSFCFDNLHTDIHTLRAFGDGYSGYETVVKPVVGRTLSVYIQ